jgi:hypothetical protein
MRQRAVRLRRDIVSLGLLHRGPAMSGWRHARGLRYEWRSLPAMRDALPGPRVRLRARRDARRSLRALRDAGAALLGERHLGERWRLHRPARVQSRRRSGFAVRKLRDAPRRVLGLVSVGRDGRLHGERDCLRPGDTARGHVRKLWKAHGDLQ